MQVRARLAGFEPAAGCLEGSCSVQLSYRRPEFIVHDRGHALDTVFANPAVAAGPAWADTTWGGLRAGRGRAYRRDP